MMPLDGTRFWMDFLGNVDRLPFEEASRVSVVESWDTDSLFPFSKVGNRKYEGSLRDGGFQDRNAVATNQAMINEKKTPTTIREVLERMACSAGRSAFLARKIRIVKMRMMKIAR